MDVSVFIAVIRETLKRLTNDPHRVVVGPITGNVRCTRRAFKSEAKTAGVAGDQRSFARPEQPASTASLISHLDPKEVRHWLLSLVWSYVHSQLYLVVRVFRCDNIPIANSDVGASNPRVEVTWDSMSFFTPVIPQAVT